jgi:Tfp pilus assembly protein FimV
MKKNDQIEFQLSLARAWIENGREDMARNIITKIINDGLAEQEKN